MEFLKDYKTFYYFMEEGIKFDLQIIKYIMAQLVSAFCYLKKNKIAYQDLHYSNILINEKNYQVKLIDFGNSSMLHNNCIEKSTRTNPQMKVPEIFYSQENRIDLFAQDVFTIGVMFCLFIFPDKWQFCFHLATLKNFEQCVYESENKDLLMPALNLISKMLDDNP